MEHTMINGITFEKLFGITEEVKVRIVTTNVCNLNCNHCDVGCDLPIKISSEHVLRTKNFTAKTSEIELFCEAFKGYGEGNIHTLQGGEVTLLPPKQLAEMFELLTRSGRRIGMKTTGYNITEIPLSSLNQLEYIVLAEHGINKEVIDMCLEYLKVNYKGEVILESIHEHRNTKSIIRHGNGTAEQGLACNHFLSTLTYKHPVIYPCCNTWAIMHNLNDITLKEKFIDAGWTVDNPNLIETLRNWKETLPQQFLETICADSCYMTANKKDYPVYEIESHSNDKLLKESKYTRNLIAHKIVTQ